jgi:hypothetical protein
MKSCDDPTCFGPSPEHSEIEIPLQQEQTFKKLQTGILRIELSIPPLVE